MLTLHFTEVPKLTHPYSTVKIIRMTPNRYGDINFVTHHVHDVD